MGHAWARTRHLALLRSWLAKHWAFCWWAKLSAADMLLIKPGAKDLGLILALILGMWK